MYRCLIFTILVGLQANAAEVSLESLSLEESPDTYSANLKFNSDLEENIPTLEFINETVQLDIPNAKVADGKILRKIEADKIKSLFAYQLDEETARFRLILKPGNRAEDLREQLRVESTPNGIRLTWPRGPKPAAQVAKRAEVEAVAGPAPKELATTEATAPQNDENIEAELKAWTDSMEKKAPVTISAEATKTVPNAQIKATEALKSEAEIPVLAPAKDAKTKSASSGGWRVILGLFVVFGALATTWWAANKWMGKKNLKNPHTNIRVITQHYLGPKKSLAIISVAGESILIGITDQNISMIKTLSLLEGEIPNTTPQDFRESLDQAAEDTVDQFEDYAVKGVKDIVSDRIKGMRNIWG